MTAAGLGGGRGSRPRCTPSVMALPILVMLIWRSEAHGGQTGRLVQLEDQMALDLIRRCATAGSGSTSASLVVAGAGVPLRAASAAKLTLSRNLAFSAIVLAGCLRDPAADRLRLGLCRHAAGALSDRGRAARDPLSRRADRHDWRRCWRCSGCCSSRRGSTATTFSLGIAADDQTAKLAGARPCPDGARG